MYCEDDEANTTAAVPTTLSVTLTLGLLYMTALYVFPPLPRFKTVLLEIVLVSKE